MAHSALAETRKRIVLLWQYVIDELCFLRSEWRSINRFLQYLRMNWQISYKNFIYTNVALQLNAEFMHLPSSVNRATSLPAPSWKMMDSVRRCASSLD